VTIQKDDGQKVTIAQRDDGDVQLGDRVQIVQGRDGVAKVVRDTSRNPD
jgi:outer membrane lipoprotein SlyB